jgi:hypothetical protein
MPLCKRRLPGFRPRLFPLEDRTLPGEAALGPLVSACLLLPTHDPVAPVENWLGSPFPGPRSEPETIEIFHGPGQSSAAYPEAAPAEDLLDLLPIRESFVSAAPAPAATWFAAAPADTAATRNDSEPGPDNQPALKESEPDPLPDDPLAEFDLMATDGHPASGAGPFRGQVSDTPNPGGGAGGGNTQAAASAAPPRSPTPP